MITRGERNYDYIGPVRQVVLQRIYDRLRKRSLRKSRAYEASMNVWDDDLMDAVFEDRISFYGLKSHGDVAHAAYVRGVRDALEAVGYS